MMEAPSIFMDTLMAKKSRGLFIALEGGEGTGKTTLATWLMEQMKLTGRTVVEAADPGTTPLAVKIRDILLDADIPCTNAQQLMLFTVARSALADEIREHLNAGVDVITARWVWSTLVYQGIVGGYPENAIISMHESFVHLDPDVYVLLDCPPNIALQRKCIQKGSQSAIDEDRFERRNLDYHNMIREGYVTLAQKTKAPIIHTGSLSVPESRIQLLDACIANAAFRRACPVLARNIADFNIAE